MIYADASALVKRVIAEAESPALKVWLSRLGPRPQVVTNRIGAVEVMRAAARVSDAARREAAVLVGGLNLIELTHHAYTVAADLEPRTVRTLDALHIASAAEIPGLTAFLTYDQRMAEAAERFGLPVVSPR